MSTGVFDGDSCTAICILVELCSRPCPRPSNNRYIKKYGHQKENPQKTLSGGFGVSFLLATKSPVCPHLFPSALELGMVTRCYHHTLVFLKGLKGFLVGSWVFEGFGGFLRVHWVTSNLLSHMILRLGYKFKKRRNPKPPVCKIP